MKSNFIQYSLYCFLGLFCFVQAGIADTLYKTVDSQGRVTYSDKAPTKTTQHKQLVIKHGPSTPLPADFAKKFLAKKAPTQSTSKSYTGEVTLFTATWCGYCQQAKAYLNQHRIQFNEMDIDTDNGRDAYFAAGGSSGVPLLVADEKKLQGFSASSYDALFK